MSGQRGRLEAVGSLVREALRDNWFTIILSGVVGGCVGAVIDLMGGC